MKFKSVFILLICLTLLLTGCGKEKQYNPDSTISMALSTEPATLDPGMTYGLSESNVELLLFEGLTRIDENSVAQPALADSWEVSADGLTYTFHLRKDIKWSDGTPIVADDFVYSWLRVLDPDVGSSNAYMLFNIKGAEDYNSGDAQAEEVALKALDAHTLQVELSEPAAYFIDLTAFHAFYPVPRHIVDGQSDTWASNHSSIVGCGPFKIVKWAHSSEIILEKNENYWNPGVVASECIKLPISESKSTRLTMLESKLTDMIVDPPPADEDRLKAMGLYKVEPQLGTAYYEFNVTKPPFDNPEVRKAFAMAVTRKDLIEKVIRNGKQAATTFVPPGIVYNGKDFAA
ncbi:Oligopeptide ABC transporter, periplasmic oligopeptide-binding protein OppA [Anaerovibrio sp. JC8]|nr:Oligopeptide ABC transporter, periplasmic oligopeptide-binding protein OppA [Anaerovibrio sp. JC8]